MVLANEPDFKLKKKCFDLVQRLISLTPSISKELCNLIKNITSTKLIEIFKYYYYCKFIVIRRTQVSKPRPLIQKDT